MKYTYPIDVNSIDPTIWHQEKKENRLCFRPVRRMHLVKEASLPYKSSLKSTKSIRYLTRNTQRVELPKELTYTFKEVKNLEFASKNKGCTYIFKEVKSSKKLLNTPRKDALVYAVKETKIASSMHSQICIKEVKTSSKLSFSKIDQKPRYKIRKVGTALGLSLKNNTREGMYTFRETKIFPKQSLDIHTTKTGYRNPVAKYLLKEFNITHYLKKPNVTDCMMTNELPAIRKKIFVIKDDSSLQAKEPPKLYVKFKESQLLPCEQRGSTHKRLNKMKYSLYPHASIETLKSKRTKHYSGSEGEKNDSLLVSFIDNSDNVCRKVSFESSLKSSDVKPKSPAKSTSERPQKFSQVIGSRKEIPKERVLQSSEENFYKTLSIINSKHTGTKYSSPENVCIKKTNGGLSKFDSGICQKSTLQVCLERPQNASELVGSEKEIPAFQVVGSEKEIPAFQVVGSEKEIPAFQVVGSEKEMPACKVVGSEKEMPAFQVVGSEKEMPACKVVGSEKEMPACKVVGSEKEIPAFQVVGSEKEMPACKVVGSEKEMPACKVVGSEKEMPSCKVVGSEKEIPASKVVGSEKEMPATKVVGSEKEMPATKVVGSEKEMSASKVVGSEKEMPASKVVGSEKEMPASKVVGSEKKIPASKIVGSEKEIVTSKVVGLEKKMLATKVVGSEKKIPASKVVGSEKEIPAFQVVGSEKEIPAFQVVGSEKEMPACKVVGSEKEMPACKVVCSEKEMPATKVVGSEKEMPASKVVGSEKEMPASKVVGSEKKIPASKVVGSEKEIAASKVVGLKKEMLATKVVGSEKKIPASKVVGSEKEIAASKDVGSEKEMLATKVVCSEKKMPDISTSVGVATNSEHARLVTRTSQQGITFKQLSKSRIQQQDSQENCDRIMNLSVPNSEHSSLVNMNRPAFSESSSGRSMKEMMNVSVILHRDPALENLLVKRKGTLNFPFSSPFDPEDCECFTDEKIMDINEERKSDAFQTFSDFEEIIGFTLKEEDAIDFKFEPMTFEVVEETSECDIFSSLQIDPFGRVIIKEEPDSPNEDCSGNLPATDSSNCSFEGFDDSSVIQSNQDNSPKLKAKRIDSLSSRSSRTITQLKRKSEISKRSGSDKKLKTEMSGMHIKITKFKETNCAPNQVKTHISAEDSSEHNMNIRTPPVLCTSKVKYNSTHKNKSYSMKGKKHSSGEGPSSSLTDSLCHMKQPLELCKKKQDAHAKPCSGLYLASKNAVSLFPSTLCPSSCSSGSTVCPSKSHAGKNIFKCGHCSFHSQNTSKFTLHMCSQTKKKSNSYNSSKAVMEESLPSCSQRQEAKKQYPCVKCKQLFSDTLSLQKHSKIVHKIHSKKPSRKGKRKFDRSLECKICFKRYHFKHHFEKHKKIHSKVECKTTDPFSCLLCSKGFTSALLLTRHLFLCHKELERRKVSQNESELKGVESRVKKNISEIVSIGQKKHDVKESKQKDRESQNKKLNTSELDIQKETTIKEGKTCLQNYVKNSENELHTNEKYRGNKNETEIEINNSQNERSTENTHMQSNLQTENLEINFKKVLQPRTEELVKNTYETEVHDLHNPFQSIKPLLASESCQTLNKDSGESREDLIDVIDPIKSTPKCKQALVPSLSSVVFYKDLFSEFTNNEFIFTPCGVGHPKQNINAEMPSFDSKHEQNKLFSVTEGEEILKIVGDDDDLLAPVKTEIRDSFPVSTEAKEPQLHHFLSPYCQKSKPCVTQKELATKEKSTSTAEGTQKLQHSTEAQPKHCIDEESGSTLNEWALNKEGQPLAESDQTLFNKLPPTAPVVAAEAKLQSHLEKEKKMQEKNKQIGELSGMVAWDDLQIGHSSPVIVQSNSTRIMLEKSSVITPVIEEPHVYIFGKNKSLSVAESLRPVENNEDNLESSSITVDLQLHSSSSEHFSSGNVCEEFVPDLCERLTLTSTTDSSFLQAENLVEKLPLKFLNDLSHLSVTEGDPYFLCKSDGKPAINESCFVPSLTVSLATEINSENLSLTKELDFLESAVPVSYSYNKLEMTTAKNPQLYEEVIGEAPINSSIPISEFNQTATNDSPDIQNSLSKHEPVFTHSTCEVPCTVDSLKKLDCMITDKDVLLPQNSDEKSQTLPVCNLYPTEMLTKQVNEENAKKLNSVAEFRHPIITASESHPEKDFLIPYSKSSSNCSVAGHGIQVAEHDLEMSCISYNLNKELPSVTEPMDTPFTNTRQLEKNESDELQQTFCLEGNSCLKSSNEELTVISSLSQFKQTEPENKPKIDISNECETTEGKPSSLKQPICEINQDSANSNDPVSMVKAQNNENEIQTSEPQGNEIALTEMRIKLSKANGELVNGKRMSTDDLECNMQETVTEKEKPPNNPIMLGHNLLEHFTASSHDRVQEDQPLVNRVQNLLQTKADNFMEQSETQKKIFESKDNPLNPNESKSLFPDGIVALLLKENVMTRKNHCFRCSFCEFKTEKLFKLNLHLEEHSHLYPFECSFCPQRFSQSIQLRLHIKDHDGDIDETPPAEKYV